MAAHGSNYRIPVHLFSYCLLLFKNDTLITIHLIHMQISGQVFYNLAKKLYTNVSDPVQNKIFG